MIRTATRQDIPALVGMAERFHNASPVSFLAFDQAAAAFMAAGAIGSPSFLALVLDLSGPSGAIIAQAQPYPLGRQIITKEAVFWIEPEHRGHWARPMMAAYEQWARGLGAVACGMSCFSDGRTIKLFERAGFTPFETHTMKRL